MADQLTSVASGCLCLRTHQLAIVRCRTVALHMSMEIRGSGTIAGTSAELGCSFPAVVAGCSGHGTWRSSGIEGLQMPLGFQVGKEIQAVIGMATRE